MLVGLYVEESKMGVVTAILLAAFFLAIPIGIKYLLAFETRGLMKVFYEQEGEVRYLETQLESLERERLVVKRAMSQVHEQRRWVDIRRDSKARELEQMNGLLAAGKLVSA